MGLSRWVGVCVSMHTHIHVPPHTHMYPHTHMHPQDGWSPILPSGINISGSHGDLTGDKALHCCGHKRRCTPAYVDNHYFIQQHRHY